MQPERFVTCGLVLRETVTRDADKILTVLTPDRGRLSVIARGAVSYTHLTVWANTGATSRSPWTTNTCWGLGSLKWPIQSSRWSWSCLLYTSH